MCADRLLIIKLKIIIYQTNCYVFTSSEAIGSEWEPINYLEIQSTNRLEQSEKFGRRDQSTNFSERSERLSRKDRFKKESGAKQDVNK